MRNLCFAALLGGVILSSGLSRVVANAKVVLYWKILVESLMITEIRNQIICPFQELDEHFPSSSSSRGGLDPLIDSDQSSKEEISARRQNSHLRPHYPTLLVTSSSEQPQDVHNSHNVMATKIIRKPKRHIPVKLLDSSEDSSVLMMHGLLRIYA